MNFGQWINECRHRMGRPPRRFMFWNWSYLKAKPPSWLREYPDDALWTNFREQARLRREGRIFWGQLVQANALLFQAGPDDCPASFLFSADPDSDEAPETLEIVARAIFQLKDGQHADPLLAELARSVTEELTRDWFRVPQEFSGMAETWCCQLMVLRKHLPLGYLPPVNLPYPILALPGQSTAALIVPSRYWPRELVAAHERAGRG